MTLPWSSRGELADGSRSCREARRKLKLHSGSTRNHENEWKTNNLGWMLYSVYAVLSVNSRSWHGEIERDD